MAGALKMQNNSTEGLADHPIARNADVRCLEHRGEHNPDHYTSAPGSLDTPSG